MTGEAFVVYAIRNAVNGLTCVGSTARLHNRWNQHKSDLKGNRHCNRSLQRDWIAHGAASFEFWVLEQLTGREGLFRAERRWIGRLNAREDEGGYNVNRIVRRNSVGAESQEDAA
jgi:group I intron endonuclease